MKKQGRSKTAGRSMLVQRKRAKGKGGRPGREQTALATPALQEGGASPAPTSRAEEEARKLREAVGRGGRPGREQTALATPALQKAMRLRGAPRWGRGAGTGEKFEALVKLQGRLLAADGCPWDREQTHETLRTYLVEETYEVLEALESGDAGKFADELGDLLLQIVFHAELARKAGRFGIGDVIERIHGKMVRRHPHVFGEARAKDAKAVLKNWEEMKREERREAEKGRARQASPLQERASLLDGVAKTLPAVLEAYQLTRRAARIGFDWEDLEGLIEKVEEEARELREAVGKGSRPGRKQKALATPALQEGGASPAPTVEVEEEAGDLLFVAVNVARFLGVDPEIALKKANRKFAGRFRWMEREAERRGEKLGETKREEMETLWDAAKEQAWR